MIWAPAGIENPADSTDLMRSAFDDDNDALLIGSGLAVKEVSGFNVGRGGDGFWQFVRELQR